MTPRTQVEWLDLTDTEEENRRKIRDSAYSRFPVVEGDAHQVVGIVQVKDLLTQMLGGRPFDIRAAVRPAFYLPDTVTALRALELFKQRGEPMALVVDEYGDFEGMLTLHDILQSLVGDIARAGRGGRAGGGAARRRLVARRRHAADRRGQGPHRPARAARREGGDFHTLGGFMMARINRVPAVGDRVEVGGFRFEVVNMDGRRVDRVLITPPKRQEAHAMTRLDRSFSRTARRCWRSMPARPAASGKRSAHDMPRPDAVLCVSAHWCTEAPVVSAAARARDDPRFLRLPRAALPPLSDAGRAGAGARASRRCSRRRASPAPSIRERGLDHGAWVPLRVDVSAADIPVASSSRCSRGATRRGIAARAARWRRCARKVCWCSATGGAVHNLREMRARRRRRRPPGRSDFDDWLAATLAAGDEAELLDWQRRAPEPRRAHPTPEHFLPLFVAYGAAGPGARGDALHHGFTLGSMSMAAYRFAA